MPVKKRTTPKPGPPPTPQPQSPANQEAKEELAEPKEVQSSMLATVAWSEDELEVVFQSGSEESYHATEQDARDLLAARSKGKWMWEHYQPHGYGSNR